MIQPNTFTPIDKIMIAKYIKLISLKDTITDFNKLKIIGNNLENISSRCRIGNNTVDYFTFTERLNTKGKYNINFFEFIANIEEFKKKKFIKNMLDYYDNVKNKNKTKNNYVVLKEVYNICISAINIFRPLVAMEIYTKYKPTTILDFTCGWGGRLVGACALNIPNYIGIDTNKTLLEPYKRMVKLLKQLGTKTKIKLFFKDALKVDYSKLDYDLVLTSPPYYNLEIYEEMESRTEEEWNQEFYIPLFTKTYKHLKNGGHYILNIPKKLYEDVCIDLLGKADIKIPLKKKSHPKKKSSDKDYSEFLYVWKK